MKRSTQSSKRQREFVGLLDRRVKRSVLTDPFAHIEHVPAVDARRYAAMQTAFPPLDQLTGGRRDYDSNQVVRLAARDVVDNPEISELWRAFFSYHVSQAWWDDIVRIFGDELRKAHPDLEEKVGRPFEKWRAEMRGTDGGADIRLDCQFVYNTPVTKPSSVKGVHVDRDDKIFSALFYCRPADDTSIGGDLKVYRFTKPAVYDKHQVPANIVDETSTLKYESNKLICFVNSPQSLHSITVRQITPVARRYINLIAETPFRAFELTPMSWPSKMIYRAFNRDWSRVYSPNE